MRYNQELSKFRIPEETSKSKAIGIFLKQQAIAKQEMSSEERCNSKARDKFRRSKCKIFKFPTGLEPASSKYKNYKFGALTTTLPRPPSL